MSKKINDFASIHGEALFTSFEEYYFIMYNHIRRYQYADRKKQYNVMFESLTQLFDFVSIKFNEEEETEILAKFDALRDDFAPLRKPQTKQAQGLLYQKQKEKSSELRALFRRIQRRLDNMGMLIPAFQKDFRPVSVR